MALIVFRLTLKERIKIYEGIKSGKSNREISRDLSRTINCINVEIRRNGGRISYDPNKAEEMSQERLKRKNSSKIKFDPSEEQMDLIKKLYNEGHGFHVIRRKVVCSPTILQRAFKSLGLKGGSYNIRLEYIEKKIDSIEKALNLLFEDRI